jgi:hypothetical protein
MQSIAVRFTIRSLAKRKLTRYPTRTYAFSRNVAFPVTEAKSVIDVDVGRAQHTDADSDWVKSTINQILQTYSSGLTNSKDGKKYGNDSSIDSVSSISTQSVRNTSRVVSEEDLNKAVQYLQVCIASSYAGYIYFSQFGENHLWGLPALIP